MAIQTRKVSSNPRLTRPSIAKEGQKAGDRGPLGGLAQTPLRRSGVNKARKRIYRGIVHIQASYHNTIITITSVRGDVLCWSSAGACGFKGKRKSTSFAAKKAAEMAARKSKDFAMKEAKVVVTGPGKGRESAIREIFKAGIKVYVIREKTGIPHNGCRPPKKRR